MRRQRSFCVQCAMACTSRLAGRGVVWYATRARHADAPLRRVLRPQRRRARPCTCTCGTPSAHAPPPMHIHSLQAHDRRRTRRPAHAPGEPACSGACGALPAACWGCRRSLCNRLRRVDQISHNGVVFTVDGGILGDASSTLAEKLLSNKRRTTYTRFTSIAGLFAGQRTSVRFAASTTPQPHFDERPPRGGDAAHV